MGQEQGGRRRYPRVILQRRTTGRVAATYELSLLNISLGGALLEHVDLIRPGTIIPLSVDLQGGRVSAKCCVVRSVVHRTVLLPDGERALIYHTGVEFLNPSEETQHVISDSTQSITGDGKGSNVEKRGLRGPILKELEELDRLLNAARRTLMEGTTPTDRAG